MQFKSCPSSESTKSEDFINLGKVSWLKKRYIAPQNIVIQLFHRSINLLGHARYNGYRQFYQVVTPNFTVCNVKKPPCFLRKFSPCGR